MQVASVHTYPVKGCYRRDHETAVVEPWGLAGDRRWLVVDPAGRCVTQREAAALARIRPEPQPDGGLLLRTDGAPELAVPRPDGSSLVDANVHGTTVAAAPAADAAGDWLTVLLDRKVRLVWLDDPTRRPVDQRFGEPDDRVSFADAYPLLLTNTASLDAVNGWIVEGGGCEAPLPMHRFRPNVVVAGAGAWAEDGWLGRRLRIGPVTFRVVKACSRCVVTTTDQENGERGQEPLRTLARYRRVDQKLLFGVNLIPDPPYGEITVDNPVELLR